MKPTTEEQDFLSKYLNKNLRYRETFREFYDHMLTGLETKPDDMPFRDAVESIVKTDFGSFEGMSAIETKYKKAIFKEVRRKYLTQLIACFKFPIVGFTTCFALLCYWIIGQPWFSFWVFFGIFFSMRITTSLLNWARNIKSGYVLWRPKRSVKDGVFEWLSYLPIVIFTLFILKSAVNNESPTIWFKNASPLVLITLLMVFALHILTYYKVYKGEFKTSSTR